MKTEDRIASDHYTGISYHQFSQSPVLTVVRRTLGVLSWPLAVPIALLARFSDFIFVSLSQALSIVPYFPGAVLREEFYRFSLRACGRNVAIGFGTVFFYRDISIGSNVLIGMYNTIHHCDFEDYVLTADGCRFLSGSHYHFYDKVDVPMALQGGELRRIRLGRDCWIGANSVVMASVGTGAVVGAGSVVTTPTEEFSIVAGVPTPHLK